MRGFEGEAIRLGLRGGKDQISVIVVSVCQREQFNLRVS